MLYLEGIPAVDEEYISSISKLVSRNGTSPASVSSADAAALAEIFREV